LNRKKRKGVFLEVLTENSLEFSEFDFFNLSLDYLAGRTDNTAINKSQEPLPFVFSEDEEALIRKYRSLNTKSKEGFRKILDVVNSL
jgi:hypothetical protein